MKKIVRLTLYVIIVLVVAFSAVACTPAANRPSQTQSTAADDTTKPQVAPSSDPQQDVVPQTPPPTIIEKEEEEEGEDLSAKFDLTNRVLKFIQEYYYDDIDYDEADLYAAYGLVSSLGKYNYINAITDLLVNATDGKGFGLLVRNTKYNEHLIDVILEGSPFETPYEGRSAQRGDEIYAIDGVRLSGLDSSTYSAYISALPSDRDVTFTLKRGEEFFDVKYTKIYFTFPYCFYINDLPGEVPTDFGYICIRTFDGSTNVAEEFHEAVRQYIEDGNKALILDLRGNGGGSSIVFSSIASALIGSDAVPGEDLLEIHYAKQNYSSIVRSTYAPNKIDTPIYVLCDGGTASASEALIGTMMAHGTLTALIGTETVGKGVAQNGFMRFDASEPGFIIDQIRNEEGETVDDLAYLIQVVVGKYYIYDASKEDGKYCIHENPFVPDIPVVGDNVVDVDYAKDIYIRAAIAEYTKE